MRERGGSPDCILEFKRDRLAGKGVGPKEPQERRCPGKYQQPPLKQGSSDLSHLLISGYKSTSLKQA